MMAAFMNRVEGFDNLTQTKVKDQGGNLIDCFTGDLTVTFLDGNEVVLRRIVPVRDAESIEMARSRAIFDASLYVEDLLKYAKSVRAR